MAKKRIAKSPDERHRDVRRRFEQWASNPRCEANTVSAVHNIRMAAVAEKEGLEPSMGQSPFAIARGQTFEKSLFRENAASLVAELARTGVLPTGTPRFVDLRLRLNGGRMRTLDESRAKTSELLREVAAEVRGKKTGTPILIAGATICVPGGVMLPEAILVVDALVIRCDQNPAQLVVGEIKTYPDRGGYTDRVELATARAQAGVYVHGLRVVLDQELSAADAVKVADSGFLVLSRPGFSSRRSGPARSSGSRPSGQRGGSTESGRSPTSSTASCSRRRLRCRWLPCSLLPLRTSRSAGCSVTGRSLVSDRRWLLGIRLSLVTMSFGFSEAYR